MEFLAEDARYHQVKAYCEEFITKVNATIPEARLVLAIEHPVIKHTATSKDMPIHEILGLLAVTIQRIGMLDLDDIRFRLEATKAKNEQVELLRNIVPENKFKN